MTTQPTDPATDPARQRDALMESERKAAEDQPKSFRDEAVTDKVVEIPPVEQTERPIEGLDPDPK